MASSARRFADNAPGDFYVDQTCIDCGTCRRVAPASFAEARDHSFVATQPRSDAELARARMALVACPVGAIGTVSKHALSAARAAFPEPIEDEVHYCGWASERAYGASSYLIVREAGNVLVDSPRFARPLVERLEALGGVRHMFLTHRDDIADHARFAEQFGCERIIHASDATGALSRIERVLAGDTPFRLADDLVVIPTPGHSPGSACLLYRQRYLFSGDHLAWQPHRQRLYAFRDYCWHDWAIQTQSMRRLLEYRFEWVLPGHGHGIHLPERQMAAALQACVRWMERATRR